MNILASLLPFLCAVVALFRAPIVALPLLPSCLLIAARAGGLVDISSASHPLRILVPLASMVFAFAVALREQQKELQRVEEERLAVLDACRSGDKITWPKEPSWLSLASAVLLFASAAVDVLALPLWRIPGTWALVPVQIGVCVLVIGVLLAPERWIRGLLRSV